MQPDRVTNDEGYSKRKFRRYLRRPGNRAVIPRLSNDPKRCVRFDRADYRERNVVERAINRRMQSRVVATRYEKLEATFLAQITRAALLPWGPD